MKKNRKIVMAMLASLVLVITIMGVTIVKIKEKMDTSAIDLTQTLLDNMADKIAGYKDEDEAVIEQYSKTFSTKNETKLQEQLRSLIDHHDYLNAMYVKDGKGIDAHGTSITAKTLPYQGFTNRKKAFSPAINGAYGVWETVLQLPMKDGGQLYVEIPFSRYSQGNDLTFYNQAGFACLIDASSKKIVLTSKTPNVIWNYMQDGEELFAEIGFDKTRIQTDIYDTLDQDESLVVKGKVQKEAVYVSIRAIKTDCDWYLCGIIPVNVIQQESSLVLRMLLAVFVLMILSLAFIIVLISYEIYQSVKKEKKRLEASELENAIYGAMSEASDLFMCMYDKKEQVLEKAFYNSVDLLGIESQVLLDHPELFKELLNSFDADLSTKIRKKEILETTTFEIERVHPLTGEKRDLRLIIKNINVVGKEKYIFFIADISHDIQIQESLRMAVLDAKQANQAKSDFLSKMSHEIRTPMNAIMGMSELAIHNLHNEEKLKNYLHKIAQSSTHLLTLINDILDLSKIESGKMVLYEETFVLSDCISDVFGIIDMQAKAKKQTFTITSANVLHDALYGDMMKLKQVLINLLNNAVKYTPENGHIQLQICEMKKTNEHLLNYEFTISDDGIGMSEDFLQRIGEPFEQEKNQFYGKENGTGLGLSIVKNIVSIMGGVLDIKSVQHEGTTIKVQLSFEENEKDSYKDKKLLEGMRIYVVDDDPLVLQDVSACLRELDMSVNSSLLGTEAFHDIEDSYRRQEPYDAVIIDWKLPDIDGMRLAQLLRERIEVNIPIIFISAYDYSEIKEEALRVGVDDFIEKPLFKSRLYKALLAQKVKDSEQGYDESVLYGRHVLLVEDNSLNQEIAKELLAMKQISVDVANNGQEAVTMFIEQDADTYDAILMDIQMPGMDGFEATKAIRHSEQATAQSIPIIAMSANTFADDVKKCLDIGMNAHVSKPVSLENLMEVLADIWK